MQRVSRQSVGVATLIRSATSMVPEMRLPCMMRCAHLTLTKAQYRPEESSDKSPERHVAYSAGPEQIRLASTMENSWRDTRSRPPLPAHGTWTSRIAPKDDSWPSSNPTNRATPPSSSICADSRSPPLPALSKARQGEGSPGCFGLSSALSIQGTRKLDTPDALLAR